MALLREISAGTIASTKPTPVEKYVINKYFVENELFNLMEFVSIGLGSNIGNIQCTVVTFNAPENAKFRGLGEEYEVADAEPKAVTLTLKMLGGEFTADRVLQRAFSNSPGALDTWTEMQIGQKVNSIIIGFARYFVGGNSQTNAKQFDGLVAYFSGNLGQMNTTALELPGGLDETNAMKVEKFLNESVARINGTPTCLITTRLKGKPFLQTLEAYRHRGVNAVTVNDKEYQSFMGIPIVGLEDSAFTEFKYLTEGCIPFIFCRMDAVNGIRVALPQDSTNGAVLDIVRPKLGNDGGSTDSVFVRQGGVEMCCVPIIEDFAVASFCQIKETEASTTATE